MKTILCSLYKTFCDVCFVGYCYERLDGSVRGEERYLAIQNFNETEDTFIFLLSTRAGETINPLRSNTDQRQISLCKINEVMRIKDTIIQHEFLWYISKFSPSLL